MFIHSWTKLGVGRSIFDVEFGLMNIAWWLLLHFKLQKHRTSNIQHPTPNPARVQAALQVRCSVLDVRRFPRKSSRLSTTLRDRVPRERAGVRRNRPQEHPASCFWPKPLPLKQNPLIRKPRPLHPQPSYPPRAPKNCHSRCPCSSKFGSRKNSLSRRRRFGGMQRRTSCCR